MSFSVEGAASELKAVDGPFWLTPTAYWMPEHYPVSAWLTHAPFSAWVLDSLRPRTIVELGTHYGFSCFAFAEAAKRLRLDATIHALDSWAGDDHAGFYGEDVYEYVQSVVAADYSESVRLLRGWFSESRGQFADASVDLLHVDGRHAYEDVLTDYREWRSVVRDGGVILFHDIAEREQGFGVWQLWEEIAEPGRSFTFEHGHGLGVLAVGEISAPGLRGLFTADENAAARIRADFVQLGEAVSRRAWLESLPTELHRVNSLVHERQVRVDELSEAILGQGAYIESLKASTSWRVTAPLRAIGRLRPSRG